MNVLLLASHAVAEFDDVRMFTDLGMDVFAPGGYEIPGRIGEGIRPTLPNAPEHPDLVDACNRVRGEKGEPGAAIDWAKAALPDEVIDWADVIIVHHFPERWIGWQFDRIRHKRVIWRTCGQSNPQLEDFMASFRRKGLQVVRYSPAEERHFTRLGTFAGQDALIRFGKYPEDYGPWIGDNNVVGNLTQHMAQRGDACGYEFWREATDGLPTQAAGDGSEVIGGLGKLSYPAMIDYLRHLRVYLYTGTRPASYTLGLIEAMLSGVPIVSIGAQAFGDGWGGEDLFEPSVAMGVLTFDDPARARNVLGQFLEEPGTAAVWNTQVERAALELFDVKVVGEQWREFLS